MAVGDRTVWISTSSTDFNDANNWSNGVPGNVIDFDPNGYVDGVTGTADITTNVDRSAGNDFSLHVSEAYAGNIGSSGNALKLPLLASTNVHITHRGSGSFYLSGITGTSPQLRVTVDSPNMEDALVIEDCGVTNQVTFAFIKKGKVKVAATGVLNTAMLFSDLSDIEIVAADSTEASTNTYLLAGRAQIKRALGASSITFISGGRYEYLAGNLNASAFIAQLGGQVILKPSAAITTGLLYPWRGRTEAHESEYPIDFNQIIWGPDIRFLDTQEEISGTFEIDLRKQFP